MMLVTLNRDVKAAFNAKWLFLAIDIEILLSVLTFVLLNASSMCHQQSFRFKDLSVT